MSPGREEEGAAPPSSPDRSVGTDSRFPSPNGGRENVGVAEEAERIEVADGTGRLDRVAGADLGASKVPITSGPFRRSEDIFVGALKVFIHSDAAFTCSISLVNVFRSTASHE